MVTKSQPAQLIDVLRIRIGEGHGEELIPGAGDAEGVALNVELGARGGGEGHFAAKRDKHFKAWP